MRNWPRASEIWVTDGGCNESSNSCGLGSSAPGHPLFTSAIRSDRDRVDRASWTTVLEDHRTAVRNIRRDGNEKLKKMLKDKTISEDDEKNGLAEIQKLTDDYIHKLEDVAKKKEQEILTV